MTRLLEAFLLSHQGVILLFIALVLTSLVGVHHLHLSSGDGARHLRIARAVFLALMLLALAFAWAGASRTLF